MPGHLQIVRYWKKSGSRSWPLIYFAAHQQGYKADVQGRKVVFALGYSHPIEFQLPEGIEAKAERLTTKGSIQQYQTTLTVSGIDKQKLGQVCAEMHKLRKPDAYKGKGVRYADVQLKLKPGKTGK